MTKNALLVKIDGERAITDIISRLHETAGEMLLDFSSVHRIDPAAVTAMQNLAAAAHEKAIKVSLQGVNVNVYKVLKLVKLTAQFSFEN